VTIRLALVGCGLQGQGFLSAAQLLSQVRICVVADPSKEQREKAAREVDAQPVESWEQVLEIPGLDGVIIATPNYLHVPIALAAAAKGLHVFCEKPMATNWEDALKMVKTCKEAGVLLAIGLSARYTRAYQRAWDLVHSGKLGEPLLVSEDYHYTLGPVLPGRTWHSDPRLMGGGALIQMGIHSLDRLCWFAGSSASRVYAQVRKAGGRWADNIALCFVEFPRGVLGQLEIAGVASASKRELTVHLSRGEVVAWQDHFRWYDGKWHEAFYATNVFVRGLENLAAAIQGKEELLCSGEAALPAHALCFAAYRSAEEGQVLSLEEFY